MLENIKEEFSFRKDYGQIDMDNLIDFEELIAFYLALSPQKNVKKLSENIGYHSIIKLLKTNNNYKKQKESYKQNTNITNIANITHITHIIYIYI